MNHPSTVRPPSLLLSQINAWTGRLLGRHGALWRLRLLRLLQKGGLSPFIRLPVGMYRLDLDARHPFHALMLVGLYEMELVAQYKRLLEPGDTYVDVGAEVGYTAALAGNRIGREGRMILFEPDPRIHPRLVSHLASAPSDRAPRTVLFDWACSDRRGEFALGLASHSGQSRLIQSDAVNWMTPSHEVVAIQTIPAAEALNDEGVDHIRLLKMDVEGHELPALRGLETWLADKRIDAVIIESNPWLLTVNGYGPGHLHAFFRQYDYVGAHEDGQAIDRRRLEKGELENLTYARDIETLRRALPGYQPPPAGASDWTADEYQAMIDEMKQENHPAVLARRLILCAAEGDLDVAIEKAEALLAERPELDHLRGHLAHWLCARKDWARAVAHYDRLIERNPEDTECQARLDEARRHCF